MAASKSKLSMWRAIIGMAYADGVLQDEEREYLTSIFDNMKERGLLTAEQYDLLQQDLSRPADLDTVLADITEPIYRSQLTYFARLLAYKDGIFDPSEEQMLEKLHTKTNAISPALRAEINTTIQKELILHEADKDSIRPGTNAPMSWFIDKIALLSGHDLLDE